MADTKIDAIHYRDRGFYCFRLHKIDQAKLNLARFSKLSYGKDLYSANAESERANCLYYEKNYAKAILKYKKALLFHPKHYNAYNRWGSSLSNLGHFDDAIEKFKKALELFPSYTISRMNIVLALFLKKNDEEALETFKEIKNDFNFRYEQDFLMERYQREIEMLEMRISKTTIQSEILLIQGRKQGVERLLALLSEKHDEEERQDEVE